MSNVLSGRKEGLAYSLSRWTDVPAAKWGWFLQCLEVGHMLGVDPRTGVPLVWSLRPEDVVGLIFWTRDPTNLIWDASKLAAYPLTVHVSVTGWSEVEHGAPSLERGAELLARAVRRFGPDRVTWRFSPVPIVPDAFDRFRRIARVAERAGVERCFLSFIQANDTISETRSVEERTELTRAIQASTSIQVLLCADESDPIGGWRGICEPASFVGAAPVFDGCGCAKTVDPFTITESCVFGCEYCYAADRTIRRKKRDTTRIRLPMV